MGNEIKLKLRDTCDFCGQKLTSPPQEQASVKFKGRGIGCSAVVSYPKPASVDGLDIRKEVCRMTSEMLDNPDQHGIYPTTKFYNDMEQFIRQLLRGEK